MWKELVGILVYLIEHEEVTKENKSVYLDVLKCMEQLENKH